ncbi:MAG TPA: type II toxin-antitoxin system HicB family antitoxin [Candidatus Sulfotelmatobacter sp.]|nr:type II toxin-antitoxin system HicB family antitoxin [Candidatus Sulfotelmatobacter sp.]
MRWDYRLVRRIVDGKERLGIHRAFYANDTPEAGTPQAVSLAPSTVEGDHPAEILAQMALALSKPEVRFEDLENQSMLAGFLASEDRRLFVGLLRKADGMDHYLSQLKEEAPYPDEWPCEEPPDMDEGSFIAFARKFPHEDFLLEFPDLPGCSARGHSLEQAQTLARQAMTAHLDELKRQGRPIPTPRGWQELSVSPLRRAAALIVLSPYTGSGTP